MEVSLVVVTLLDISVGFRFFFFFYYHSRLFRPNTLSFLIHIPSLHPSCPQLRVDFLIPHLTEPSFSLHLSCNHFKVPSPHITHALVPDPTTILHHLLVTHHLLNQRWEIPNSSMFHASLGVSTQEILQNSFKDILIHSIMG